MTDPLLDLKKHPTFWPLVERCKPYSLTSPERMFGLYQALRYVVENRIEGAIVECGVWKGGSMLLAALTLLELGDTSRELWLFDTFDGMTEPGPEDVPIEGASAQHFFEVPTLRVGIAQVATLMFGSGYPLGRIRYAVGDVCQTAQEWSGPIALLRLDTDWYASTRAEMEWLYPHVVPGGVVIVDDYGHWQGNGKAVDEELAALGERPILYRLDYSGRIFTRPAQSLAK